MQELNQTVNPHRVKKSINLKTLVYYYTIGVEDYREVDDIDEDEKKLFLKMSDVNILDIVDDSTDQILHRFTFALYVNE